MSNSSWLHSFLYFGLHSHSDFHLYFLLLLSTLLSALLLTLPDPSFSFVSASY